MASRSKEVCLPGLPVRPQWRKELDAGRRPDYPQARRYRAWVANALAHPCVRTFTVVANDRPYECVVEAHVEPCQADEKLTATPAWSVIGFPRTGSSRRHTATSSQLSAGLRAM